MEQYPVSGLQSNLYRTHPFGYVLGNALYHTFSQIGGNLRPGICGNVDAAVHRGSHVGGNLPGSVIFQ